MVRVFQDERRCVPQSVGCQAQPLGRSVLSQAVRDSHVKQAFASDAPLVGALQ
jgi:hypothetical protein